MDTVNLTIEGNHTETNNTNRHKELTQKYSTWGDKLLQHTDVLYKIQHDKIFRPITIQLAPVEACDSTCPFCSVSGRPLKSYMSFVDIKQCLTDFRILGAKSLEITGGGNPALYKDRQSKETINDIIKLAHDLEYDIGIITNSHNLKYFNKEVHNYISWMRISLIQLDEGISPEQYDFNEFPIEKIAFSYIIYDSEAKGVFETKRKYIGTTKKTIEDIARLVDLHPEIKFVRIAGNCLIKGNNAAIKEQYKDIIDAVDKYHKFFIKDIGYDDDPYNEGCYVGAIRPYVAPDPHGDNYKVYICTSHVLNTRTYDTDYALCDVKDIIPTWEKMSDNYRKYGYPYEVKGNKGINWCNTCKYCYYKFNNKLLHTVAQEMPDKNFP